MIAKNKTRITITIKKDTYEMLKYQAKNNNITISKLIDMEFEPFDKDLINEIIHAKWIDE